MMWPDCTYCLDILAEGQKGRSPQIFQKYTSRYQLLDARRVTDMNPVPCCGPTVLQWPLTLTVIWRPLPGACELQQVKKTAVIMLQIFGTAVQNLVPRDLCNPAWENHENWQANRILCRDLNQGSPEHGGMPQTGPWRLFVCLFVSWYRTVTVTLLWLGWGQCKWNEENTKKMGGERFWDSL